MTCENKDGQCGKSWCDCERHFEKPTAYDTHESGQQTNNADTKPWDREPTPLVNSMESANKLVGQDSSVDGEAYVQLSFARDLERRLRAAEARLASALKWWRSGYANAERELAEAHLESARKEDA